MIIVESRTKLRHFKFKFLEIFNGVHWNEVFWLFFLYYPASPLLPFPYPCKNRIMKMLFVLWGDLGAFKNTYGQYKNYWRLRQAKTWHSSSWRGKGVPKWQMIEANGIAHRSGIVWQAGSKLVHSNETLLGTAIVHVTLAAGSSMIKYEYWILKHFSARNSPSPEKISFSSTTIRTRCGGGSVFFFLPRAQTWWDWYEFADVHNLRPREVFSLSALEKTPLYWFFGWSAEKESHHYFILGMTTRSSPSPCHPPPSFPLMDFKFIRISRA